MTFRNHDESHQHSLQTLNTLFEYDDFMESMFGFRGAKQRYFDKYLSKITRFGGDYERFFRYEINQTRNICLKMTKKLSKLYSLIKDKNPQQ